jgi:hypothetical protein
VIVSMLWVAAAMFLLSVVATCWLDQDARRELGQLLLGTLAAAPLVIALGLRKAGWFQAGTLDSRTLERFARIRRGDGSRAWILSYRRRGIIWVRGLRPGEPTPPREVLTHEQVFGTRYTVVKRDG